MKPYWIVLALTAWLCAPSVWAQTHVYHLAAHPFGVSYADDGRLLVTLMGRGTKDNPNGVVAFNATPDGLKQTGFAATPGQAADMALTHDGGLLVIAAQARVVFVDMPRLLAGDANAVLGDFNSDSTDSSITTAISNDDHWLFVAEEQDERITVIDLKRVRASGFKDKAILGHIPVGPGPVGMVISSDGRYLYATTEQAASGAPTCPPEMAGGRGHAHGELDVIDVATAAVQPKKAVIAHTDAGCNPVRVLLSSGDETAFVTARGSNAVLAFDTQGLRPLGEVKVGPSPVGMALSRDGQTLFVADSDRFSGVEAKPMLVVVDVGQVRQGQMTAVRSLKVGRFPREMAVSPDGANLALGDFGGGDLLLMKIADLKTPASPSP